MPNISKINGFRPVQDQIGNPWNGKVRLYSVAATDAVALFTGDLVKLSGTADANGIAGVTQAAAGNALVGVVVGVAPDFANLSKAPFRPASTAGYVFVCDDPTVLFEAQEDGVTTPIPMVDVGLNINFIVAAGSQVTGQSAMQIDSDTKATTATLPLKLMRPKQSPDNELIALGQANTRWMVKINNHQLAASTGTAGV